MTGLGVPGSPSFLNGSTATSPFASECPRPGELHGAQPCPLPAQGGWGLPATVSPRSTLAWPSGARPALSACDLSLLLDARPSTPPLGGAPGPGAGAVLAPLVSLRISAVHLVSSPPLLLKGALTGGRPAETRRTATFPSYARTLGGG